MDKAFELKSLVEKIKAKGAPATEEMVEQNLAAFFEWLEESAAMSENQLIKGAIPMAVAVIKPMLKKPVDQIDGKEG